MSAGFHPLRILDVRRETDDAITLTLEPAPELAGAFAFAPGQHLTLRADIDGEDVRRNYSICVAPGGPLKVGVKRIAGGRFSRWAAETLKPGGTIEAMAPRGHFTWAFDPAEARTYLCFAAGSGITPILSLIAAGLAAEPDSRFTLFYGNRDSRSVIFLEELSRLKNRFIDLNTVKAKRRFLAFARCCARASLTMSRMDSRLFTLHSCSSRCIRRNKARRNPE